MNFAKFARGFCIATAISVLSSAASAQELRNVDMALAGGSLIGAIPHLVDDMGFLKKHGIKPNFVSMDSSSAAATALLSGAVAVAFSGPGSLVAAQARRQDLVAINSTYRGLGGTLVLAKSALTKIGVAPDAPIADRLRALNGLSIATPSPTSTYTINFREAAESAGAKPSFTYMAISTMPAALKKGAVDGYIASAPFWLPPIVDGSGVEWISGPRGDLPKEFAPSHTAVTLATRKYIDENKETVDAVNAAFKDFAVAVEQRPDDVKAAIRKLFPDLNDQTLNRLFEAEAVAWKAGPITPEDIANEVKIARASNPQLPAFVEQIDSRRMIYP
jgi:ABC-type nitrate/sulfonate/bicarbonate transport system substrate-binding protein